MTLFRRFLVLQLLMLWQGGFLFYTTFVVPVGTEVLGGAFAQGRITRIVTKSMNWVGLAAVIVFAWELYQARASKRRARLLWGTWLIMAIGLAMLFNLHAHLMSLVDFETAKIADRREFKYWHGVYLWICTFNWAAGLVFAWALLGAWSDPRGSQSLTSGLESKPSQAQR
ncbi:MAG: hypothetical protein K8T89_05335 [Planctomycetes bacterium]|nr:hypothetical protein [Planctomycetota bacterium]